MYKTTTTMFLLGIAVGLVIAIIMITIFGTILAVG